MLALLIKNRNLRLLIVGSFVSLLGSNMQSFALSLYVLNTTGSAAQFASTIALMMVPRLIIGPFAGVLADRFDRKKIIVNLDLLSGVFIGLISLLYYTLGHLPMWSIYLSVIVLSIVSSLFQPASQSILPTIVEKKDLFNANSANSIVNSSANLLSALVAGMLMGFFGIGIILVLNALSFIMSAISEMSIILPESKKNNQDLNVHVFFKEMAEGFDIVRKSSDIISIVLMGVVVNFIFSPIFQIAIPYVIKEIHNFSDMQYGIMQSIAVSGMIIGPLFAGKFTKDISLNKIILMSVSGIGLLTSAIGLLAFSKTVFGFQSGVLILMSMLAMFVAIFMTLSNIGIGTMFQNVVPLEAMGRVGALTGTLLSLTIPLGQIVIGLLIGFVHVGVVIILGGLFCAISAIVYYMRSTTKEKNHLVDMIEEAS